MGYNAQVAVDAKHKLIAADDVTNDVTDFQQLANVALEAKANLEIEQNRSGGRRGVLQRQRSEPVRGTGHHAVHSQGRTPARTRSWGCMARTSFNYDAVQGCLLCVRRGRELTYRFSTYELGRELKYYRARGCKTAR